MGTHEHEMLPLLLVTAEGGKVAGIRMCHFQLIRSTA